MLDQKLDSTGASVEDIAAFLEVGANYVYQLRSEKTVKNPSDKLLRRLTRYAGPSWRDSQVMKKEDELKDGNYTTKPGPEYPFIEVQVIGKMVVRVPVIGGAAGLDAAARYAREIVSHSDVPAVSPPQFVADNVVRRTAAESIAPMPQPDPLK